MRALSRIVGLPATAIAAQMGRSEGAVRMLLSRALMKLSGLLDQRGDLDWIVMRALEKDRARRYESAADFSADLNRFLARSPTDSSLPHLRQALRAGALVRLQDIAGLEALTRR